ncbi:hypothetical protein CWM47_37750 [Spirosoma pollinicola]|uniref:Uncharacterized protein n=1 Tax=Spirosoma pollinicola TaxID=2057025 RepID=A0A2K8ZB41_9BACT|nr:hypothetical protein CWM47_37750 [Spirosoma pollinicola]
MPGEHMVQRLQRLINDHQIRQIRICRLGDFKLHDQSEEWSFGHEYIQVGSQPYNLNRVVTFTVIDQVLYLYF